MCAYQRTLPLSHAQSTTAVVASGEPRQAKIIPDSDLTCQVTAAPKLSLSMPVSPVAQPMFSAEGWEAWMKQELSEKLVDVTASTSRAQVRTVRVKSANVVKGQIRAEEIDVLLEVEGTHLKETNTPKVNGIVR